MKGGWESFILLEVFSDIFKKLKKKLFEQGSTG